MDNTPVSGFITRKQASERCKRAERTLQRYWSRAIEQKDKLVLKNLKLRSEDGEIIEGIDVTKAIIDKLKKQGKNPTWYVHATWVERRYGPRLEDKTESNPERNEQPTLTTPSRGELPQPQPDSDYVAVLKQQITDLKSDKEKLEQDRHQDRQHHREDFKMLKEMFDTLKEDHEGTKKLLGKALDVGVEKLRQGDDNRPSADRSTNVRKNKTPAEKKLFDVDVRSSSFVERHLPTFSRPFLRK